MKDTKYPAIADQGFPTIEIPNKDICGLDVACFNGSIIDYNGKTLLAYRAYSEKTGRMMIHLAELDPDTYQVISCRELNLYSKFREKMQEDCRLFIHKDKLWISYTDLQLQSPHWTCLQMLCSLTDDYNVDHAIPMINYGNNRANGVEKNWNFFSHNDDLWFIYDSCTQHAVNINDKTGKIIQTSQSCEMHWYWGHMRGGTPPFRVSNEHYLTFMHGSDYRSWLGRRYHMTPVLFEAKPPWRIVKIGERPIAFGSRDEPFCGSGSPSCLFPMGKVRRGDKWIVSAGINDTVNYLIEVTDKQIEDNWVDASQFEQPTDFYFMSKRVNNIVTDGEVLHWDILFQNSTCSFGLCKTKNKMTICWILNNKNAQPISYKQYLEYKNMPVAEIRKMATK